MAGTINLALSQQFDLDGEPLGGGLLYFFASGTTTPQSAFQDQLLTILHPNPIVLDASGRVPMFYLADGNIKIRLTDDSGVTVIAADNLLVIGPSSGGGGGGGVDPTTVMEVGDIKAKFSTGTLDGFVRCNGRTIGSATSSATERANADCQTLFEYLWSSTVLGVFAGATPSRGATANADWLANKQIELPDLRGRTIAGMDDMGATAASRLTSTYFGASGIVLGNAGGAESVTIAAGSLPAHVHTASLSGSGSGATDAQGSHAHTGGSLTTNPTVSGTIEVGVAGGSASVGLASGASGPFYPTTSYNAVVVGPPWTGATDAAGSHAHNVSVSVSVSGSTGNGPGLSTPTANVQPVLVLTFYIKL